jgi:hypothetical protein
MPISKFGAQGRITNPNLGLFFCGNTYSSHKGKNKKLGIKIAPSNLPFLGSPPTLLSASAYLALGFLLPNTFQLPLTQRSAPHSPSSCSITRGNIILTHLYDLVKGVFWLPAKLKLYYGF